jgi:hypothetical protein
MKVTDGISRRDVIKKGAVAGAVLWSAPVIESVVSRAAAQSTCNSTATFNASYIFVVYTVGGVTYFTGFTAGGTCGSQDSSKGGPVSTGSCGGVVYTLNNFNGAGNAQGSLTYGSSATGFQTPATYTPSPACSMYLTISGGTVSTVAGSGAQIVAAFCFGASTLTGVCADASGGGGCAYADCG